MKEVEEALHTLHAAVRTQKEAQSIDVDTASGSTQKQTLQIFAHIDQVDAGSPSEAAVSFNME